MIHDIQDRPPSALESGETRRMGPWKAWRSDGNLPAHRLFRMFHTLSQSSSCCIRGLRRDPRACKSASARSRGTAGACRWCPPARAFISHRGPPHLNALFCSGSQIGVYSAHQLPSLASTSLLPPSNRHLELNHGCKKATDGTPHGETSQFRGSCHWPEAWHGYASMWLRVATWNMDCGSRP